MIQKRKRRGRDGKVYYVWKVRWRNDAGEEKSKTLPRGTRKDEAEAYERRVMTLKRGGELDELDVGRETLADFAEHWWAVYAEPNLKRSTRVRYAEVWNTHALDRLGDLRLREIRPARLASFRAELEREGIGGPTIRKVFVVVQSMLARAVEEGRIKSNPATVVRKPPARRDREIVALAPKQVEQLRKDVLDQDREERGLRDATLIAVLAYAGLRPWSEAIALPWERMRERTLLVYATKVETLRTVDLLSPLRSDLLAYRIACGRPPGTALIFPASKGAWTRSEVANWRRRIWKPALKAAELPESMPPYDLRHSFASLLLRDGSLSLIEVAAQMGHSVAVLSSTYAHVIAELKGTDREPADEAIRRARGEVFEGQEAAAG